MSVGFLPLTFSISLLLLTISLLSLLTPISSQGLLSLLLGGHTSTQIPTTLPLSLPVPYTDPFIGFNDNLPVSSLDQFPLLPAGFPSLSPSILTGTIDWLHESYGLLTARGKLNVSGSLPAGTVVLVQAGHVSRISIPTITVIDVSDGREKKSLGYAKVFFGTVYITFQLPIAVSGEFSVKMANMVRRTDKCEVSWYPKVYALGGTPSQSSPLLTSLAFTKFLFNSPGHIYSLLSSSSVSYSGWLAACYINPPTTSSQTQCQTGYYYSYSTYQCSLMPLCPAGTTWNQAAEVCYGSDAAIICSGGMIYDATVQDCIPLICPLGQQIDVIYNGCVNDQSPPVICPIGYEYNYDTRSCEMTFPPVTDTCIVNIANVICCDPVSRSNYPWLLSSCCVQDGYRNNPISGGQCCPVGQQWDLALQTCRIVNTDTPQCPSGYHLDVNTQLCHENDTGGIYCDAPVESMGYNDVKLCCHAFQTFAEKNYKHCCQAPTRLPSYGRSCQGDQGDLVFNSFEWYVSGSAGGVNASIYSEHCCSENFTPTPPIPPNPSSPVPTTLWNNDMCCRNAQSPQHFRMKRCCRDSEWISHSDNRDICCINQPMSIISTWSSTDIINQRQSCCQATEPCYDDCSSDNWQLYYQQNC